MKFFLRSFCIYFILHHFVLMLFIYETTVEQGAITVFCLHLLFKWHWFVWWPIIHFCWLHAAYLMCIFFLGQWSLPPRQSYWLDWWGWFSCSPSACTGGANYFVISFSFYWDRELTIVFFWFWKLPEDARELDKELRQVTKDKNDAVRNQDFEKVYWTFLYP